MTNYYVVQDNKITYVDIDKTRLINTVGENAEIFETERNLSLSHDLSEYIFTDTVEYEQQQIQAKKFQFNQEFFLTSLGYIRRKVSMSTGETKDFLSDLLPVISMGIQTGQTVPIITYSLPDFSKELTTEYLESLQLVQNVTAEFVRECFLQLSNDFMPMSQLIGD